MLRAMADEPRAEAASVTEPAGDALTTLTAAEQAYLVTIRNVRTESPLTGAALARRMGVSPQATSEMLRRLGDAGVVSVDRARDVRLTPRGLAVADAIFRRHSLVEWLLT